MDIVYTKEIELLTPDDIHKCQNSLSGEHDWRGGNDGAGGVEWRCNDCGVAITIISGGVENEG